jgi:S1-C subfamily serine protease
VICILGTLLLIHNNVQFSGGTKQILLNEHHNFSNFTKMNSIAAKTEHLGVDLTGLFNYTKNSVVEITSQQNATSQTPNDNSIIGQTTVFGSGIIYDTHGHIITNNHVIGGSNVIYVRFSDGSTYAAKVTGTDPYTDLAVLRITENTSKSFVPLRADNSSLLQVGQEVAAIGNPFGLQNAMTHGIISYLGALLPTNQTDFWIPDTIVTDVPLNHGDSGGPLLDTQGKLVGMNTAIAGPNELSGISYSISSNILGRIVPQLIAHGNYEHPWLGVTGAIPVPDLDNNTKPPSKYGVMVLSVQSNSPAAKANLRVNSSGQSGDIILAIDDHPMKRFADIINYIESKKTVGDHVLVTLLRSGIVTNLDVKLAPRPKFVTSSAENHVEVNSIPSKPETKDWTEIFELSNGNVSSQGPRVTSFANNVYAVWEEGHNNGNKIIFTRSTDRGNTFSKPMELTEGLGMDYETPDIAAFQQNVYIVWTDNSQGNFDIFFTKSTDSGNTFSKPINISNTHGISYFPRIAINTNKTVYIVWTDNSQGNYNILFAKSTDGGSTFTKPIALGNTKGVSNFPSIATSEDGTVYVVWSHKNNTDFDPSNTQNQTQTYDVFFVKSLDGGNIFSQAVNLSNDPSNSVSPVVGVSKDHEVYVLWSDNSIGTYETFLVRSGDRGNTFSRPSVISGNHALSISPYVSLDCANVFAVWSDNTYGNSRIFFTKSSDNGSTFNMPVDINVDTGIAGDPQISYNYEAAILYVIWQNNLTGHSAIYFTKSHPIGNDTCSP